MRDAARKFAEERIAKVARALDREGRFPSELLGEMAGLGLMGVNVPAEYGGAEAGAVAYALALMEVARACASTAVSGSELAARRVRFPAGRPRREDQDQVAASRDVRYKIRSDWLLCTAGSAVDLGRGAGEGDAFLVALGP